MGPPYAKLKGTMMIEESFQPAFGLEAGHGEEDMAAVVRAWRER